MTFFQIPAKGPTAQAARERPQTTGDVALEPLRDEDMDERGTHQPVFKATVEVEVRGAKNAPGQGDFITYQLNVLAAAQPTLFDHLQVFDGARVKSDEPRADRICRYQVLGCQHH